MPSNRLLFVLFCDHEQSLFAVGKICFAEQIREQMKRSVLTYIVISWPCLDDYRQLSNVSVCTTSLCCAVSSGAPCATAFVMPGSHSSRLACFDVSDFVFPYYFNINMFTVSYLKRKKSRVSALRSYLVSPWQLAQLMQFA